MTEPVTRPISESVSVHYSLKLTTNYKLDSNVLSSLLNSLRGSFIIEVMLSRLAHLVRGSKCEKNRQADILFFIWCMISSRLFWLALQSWCLGAKVAFVYWEFIEYGRSSTVICNLVFVARHGHTPPTLNVPDPGSCFFCIQQKDNAVFST